MMSCKICKSLFHNKSNRHVVCSDICRKKRKQIDNLKVNHSKRGYEGYGPTGCIICESIFKRQTSRSIVCSDACRLLRKRAKKNNLQKAYHRNKKGDPEYTLKRVLRTCLGNIIKQKRIRSHNLCSYSPEQFRIHIESNFKPGMSWENWGEWHIDHIRPLASFDFKSVKDEDLIKLAREANALSNLQPLWASENLRKHARWL